MLIKRGKVWHYKILRKGKLYRKSTFASNKELAEQIEKEDYDEIVKKESIKVEKGASVKFTVVWQKYLNEVAKNELAESTYQRAEQCAKNFLPVIGEHYLTEITPKVLENYKIKRLNDDGRNKNTIAKELRFVKRVFSLCKKKTWEELIKENPFDAFEMPKCDDKERRPLKPGEYEKLLKHSPVWLHPIITFARTTGLRRANIVNLVWDEVDITNKVLHIKETKNGEPLSIPINETALSVLKEAIRYFNSPFVFHNGIGKAYEGWQVTQAFKKACRRAGILDLNFHCLRHDFGSSLAERNYNEFIIQALMGHRTAKMTKKYIKMRVDALRDAVVSLDSDTKLYTQQDEKVVKVLTA